MLLANQVGFSGIFVSRDEARCKNCDDQREKDVYYADVIPLTTILVECLQSYTGPSGLPQHLRVLESLEPEHVVPYLTKNLAWRINTVSIVHFLFIHGPQIQLLGLNFALKTVFLTDSKFPE